MRLSATAAQTVGPYFHIGLTTLQGTHGGAGSGAEGQRVAIRGRVLDGDGRPVPDALIEIWQANAHGKYAHPEDRQDKPLDPTFTGFARLTTDATGAFHLSTIKPGRVPGPGQTVQAPHLVVAVLMRGLLKHLVTRLYFPDEASNAGDPVLQLVPADRRASLVARRAPESDTVLEWNVLLQGEDETVFFDY